MPRIKIKKSKSDIKKAIVGCKGMVSVVAKRLKVSWHVADHFIKDNDLLEDMAGEKETLLDFVESKLFENVNANDTTSIIFYLKTQGKNRGYIEKQNLDITSAGNEIKQVISFGGKEIEI